MENLIRSPRIAPCVKCALMCARSARRGSFAFIGPVNAGQSGQTISRNSVSKRRGINCYPCHGSLLQLPVDWRRTVGIYCPSCSQHVAVRVSFLFNVDSQSQHEKCNGLMTTPRYFARKDKFYYYRSRASGDTAIWTQGQKFECFEAP